MKRFLVFAGDQYYPSGGAADFLAAFDNVEEALALAAKMEDWSAGEHCDWAHVFDVEKQEIITKPA